VGVADIGYSLAWEMRTMTEDQKELLEGMLYQMKRAYELSNDPQYDVTITQAYAQCMIAVQLDRIATALESANKKTDGGPELVTGY
jgi:hypothetical protein